MHRIEKTKLFHDRLKRYDDKKHSRKRKKLREKLNVGEKVLVLAERIKKNLPLKNFISSLYRTLPISIGKEHFQKKKKENS